MVGCSLKYNEPAQGSDVKKVDSFIISVSDVMNRCGVSSVVAGISGGPDSVAMLLAFVDGGVRVQAVHCNFHLRGDESDRDMVFVKDLCNRLGVPLHVIDIDVPAYRGMHGVSVEMACRETRYAEFRRLLALTGYDRIAVAHNSDDQAETILLNLMRGCGVAGLRAMKQDSGEIIRPLLHIDRKSILDFLANMGAGYVTDSTNNESEYRRNFLRNEVLPLLETRWPRAKHALCTTACILAQEEKMLEHAADIMMAKDPGKSDYELAYDAVRNCPDPAWLVRRFCGSFGANNDQCLEITRCVMSDVMYQGKYWKVSKKSCGGMISAERDRLVFIPERKHLSMPEIVCVQFENSEDVIGRVLDAPLTELWTTASPGMLAIRPVAAGDRIAPLGMKGTASVCKIFRDAKLSRQEKQNAVVVVNVETDDIVWIPGLKRSRLFTILETSGRVYRYTLRMRN